MPKPYSVIQLYPEAGRELPLEGLYLEHVSHASGRAREPFVYSNFICSLDGRIAIEHPDTGDNKVPDAIANPRDWRLFQELAARADVLVTSARYIRQLAANTAQDKMPVSDADEFADLFAWRAQHGLSPQPAVVIMSASLDLPDEVLAALRQRPVYVATGDEAEAHAVARLERNGARVLRVGSGQKVDGRRLIDALAAVGYRSIYSIAGPGVLETLLNAGVLDRLYLTHMHRLIGGANFDTLLEGRLLKPPVDLSLTALYHDQGDEDCCGQMFGVYDMAEKYQGTGQNISGVKGEE
jgi:riboflavin biosynthesis pyrimidine reductase